MSQTFSDFTPTEQLTLTLCLQEDSILISKAVLDTLGCPKQVQMMINDEQKKLLLQSCSTDDREAVVIPPQPMVQFEMSGHSLLKRIRRLTGWPDMMPRVIRGEYLSPYHAIVFDLNSAKLARLQRPSDI